MIKGGYKIVDFKGNSLSGTAVTIDGIFNQIVDNYNKVILVSGVSINGEVKDDVFATANVKVAEDESKSVELEVYNGVITVTEDDEVTLALNENVTSTQFQITSGNITGNVKVYKNNNVVELNLHEVGDATGFVTLTSGATLGTIPEGFRPKHVITGVAMMRDTGVWSTANFSTVGLHIETNGNLSFYGNNTAMQSMKYASIHIVYVVED